MPAWGDQLRRWARPVGTGALEPLNAAHGSAQDAVGSRAAWTYRPIDDQTRSSLDGTERTTFQDEIRPEPGSESPKSSISLGEDTIALEELPWSAEEEKRLVRKLDCLVMPLLILGFFSLQLDRGNIGNALTDFFLRDVGITQNQFNTGQQLMSFGIVLLEIPSNLMLYRVGPSLWIGCQVFAWGLVATFQAFQHGLGGFLLTRFLLGCCEAGFIPAGLYTVTRWYTRNETSKRFSWFFLGNMLAAALTGVISYGILHLRGFLDLSGWQWLFMIEGSFTVVVGAVFLLLFPKSTEDPVSIFGVSYFNERDARILSSRILRDDPTKLHVQSHVSSQEFFSAVTNWRLIPHILLTICGLAPASTMAAYAPTIVSSFGFERLASNALVSIGNCMLIFTNIGWGVLADKIGRRGAMVTLGLLIFWCFTAINRLLVDSDASNLKLFFLTLALGFGQGWHPVNGSWMSLNAKSAGERSVTLAVFIMSANTAGIIGSQLFRSQDAPLYRGGWTAILSLVSVSLIMSMVANVQYYMLNKKHRAVGESAEYSP